MKFKRTAVYSTRWVLDTVKTLRRKMLTLVEAPPLAKSEHYGAV